MAIATGVVAWLLARVAAGEGVTLDGDPVAAPSTSATADLDRLFAPLELGEDAAAEESELVEG